FVQVIRCHAFLVVKLLCLQISGVSYCEVGIPDSGNRGSGPHLLILVWMPPSEGYAVIRQATIYPSAGRRDAANVRMERRRTGLVSGERGPLTSCSLSKTPTQLHRYMFWVQQNEFR